MGYQKHEACNRRASGVGHRLFLDSQPCKARPLKALVGRESYPQFMLRKTRGGAALSNSILIRCEVGDQATTMKAQEIWFGLLAE